MGFNFVSIVWLHISLTILNIVFFMYTWELRKMPGSRYFLTVLCAGTYWLICQAFEICAINLETKLFLANIQYIAPIISVGCFSMIAIETTAQINKKTSNAAFSIFIGISVLFQIMVFFFPGLVRQNEHLVFNGLYYTMVKTYGPLFWIMAAYDYLVIVLSLTLLISSLYEKSEVIKKQSKLIIAAVSVPLLANVIQISGNSPLNMDLSPMAFGAASIIVIFGIAKFNLFKIIPVTRSLVIKLMKTGMVVFDTKGNLLDINPAALKLLSIPVLPGVGATINEVFINTPELIRFFDSRREQSSELAFDRNGVSYYCEATLTAIKNTSGREIAWLFQLYDITERKLAEDIIEQAAYHDPLTGLPNRQYFRLMLAQEITLAKMRGKKLSVAFLDLDSFKSINDSYGHEYGDTLLKAVTRRLGGMLREADLIARLGGDEFAIIIPGTSEEDEIAEVGERLLSVFNDEFDLFDLKVLMRASIGFSVFPDDGDSNEVLLRKADKAMYDVKKTGKNNFRTYKEKKEAV